MARSFFAALRAVFASACMVFLASAAAGAGDKGTSGGGAMTKENYQQDARIKATDATVKSVQTGLNSGVITSAKRVFEYCQPYGITERILARDKTGTVRMYEERGGSDNSDRRIKRYYNETGQLLFVLVTDAVRGGGDLVQKVYYDKTGKRIWTDNKVAGAPESSVPSNYPDDVLIVASPVKAFEAPSPCKEVAP